MRIYSESGWVQIEISPVLGSSECLGFILTAENTDHAKSPKYLFPSA